jgi:predicted hotdog family 3-hydroxylacyl-ACP dehydratase
MMLDRTAIEALIPHRGAMCLLTRVLEWDAQRIVLATDTHRASDNPLRSGERLRALHLCEYGAQAMAVHGGLIARAAGTSAPPAMLVSLREVELHRQYLEGLGGELVVHAERLLSGRASQQYAFRVYHEDELLAAGRAAIIERPG